MKVLSLFDGIAGARQALKELNIDCEYYAIEIDKYAYHIATSNHWDIRHLGVNNYTYDVKDFLSDEWERYPKEIQDIVKHTEYKEKFVEGNIDLLIGGSPCQDLSGAKRHNKGLEGEKSSLFFEYVRILNKIKPKYFVLENVASMSKKSKEAITKELHGVEPILIDSAKLTAQQRKRYYWIGELVNGKYQRVNVAQPEDQGILLKNILESGDTEKLKAYCITATYNRACLEDYFHYSQRQLVWIGAALRGRYIVNGKRKDIKGAKTTQRIETRIDEKVNCLTTVNKDSLVVSKDMLRKLTVTECERLQGFPDGYCDMVSKTQAYKALGNSFTVPVIKHILSYIKNDKSEASNRND